jgi:hypothetical protein
MSKASIQLSSLCRDLQDRYGREDPLVQELLTEIRQTEKQTLVLPFGERRQHDLPKRIWSLRLRKRPARF